MNLPDWLQEHLEAWEGFCEMRRKMPRIPFTERAMRIAIKELDRLRMEGFNVGEVLDQSTFRGWRGVFPVYGQQPQRVLRDQNGNKYRITAEGTRQLVQ